MHRARAVQVHILEPVGSFRRSRGIEPPIGFGAVLRLAAAKEERGTGDKRWIQAMLTLSVLAIDIEAEVSDFFPRMPDQYDASFGPRERLERGQLHCRRRLNRGNRSRSVVREIRITRRGGNRGRVGCGRGRTESRGVHVDGDDDEAADTDRAKIASDRSGGLRASSLCGGNRGECDLSGQRIGNTHTLGNGRPVVGHLQGIGEVGTLIDGFGSRGLQDGNVGLRGRSNDGGGSRGVVCEIGIRSYCAHDG